MTNALQTEFALARTLAREAGRLILEVYATEFAVTDKGGGEGPVTEADRRANAFIVGELRKAFPRDGTIAEESKDNAAPGTHERLWFVDPLDGTREFVNRNGEFAVQIGLAIRGEPVLGVVYRPVGDVLYAGIVGEGAEREDTSGRRSIHVRDESDPSKLTLLVSRSHRPERTDRLLSILGVPAVKESGSVGLKCGLLAEGAADLYLHFSGRSSRWDSCGPEAILRAAGGGLTDVYRRRYRYLGDELLNRYGLFGFTPACVDAIAPRIDELLSILPQGIVEKP